MTLHLGAVPVIRARLPGGRARRKGEERMRRAEFDDPAFLARLRAGDAAPIGS